jgi:hypothetical protein
MTTATFEPLGPCLVSELPPAAVPPGLLARLRHLVVLRVQERRFEAALRQAAPGEHSDLIAAARRG